MRSNRSKKIAAAVGMSAVAVTAVVGGTLAQFTDSDTSAPQVLEAGTVAVELVEGGTWNTNIDNLAVGDTVTRTVNIDNTSSLDISAIRLTSDVTSAPGPLGGVLADAVEVTISQGATELASDVVVDDLAVGYDLVFDNPATVGVTETLAANTDVPLTFEYTVVGAPAAVAGDRTVGDRATADNPDNEFQGAAMTVEYTIDAIQRPGAAQ